MENWWDEMSEVEKQQAAEAMGADGLRELTEMLSKVEERSRQISPETPMRFRLSLGQLVILVSTVVVTIVGFLGTVAGGAWWLSAREAKHEARLETIASETDKKLLELRADFNKLIVELKDAMREQDGQLSLTVREMQSRIPTEFPPKAWLEDVYRRDMKLLRDSLESLRRELESIKRKEGGADG